MNKKALSKIPQVPASQEMIEAAGRIEGKEHIVTAKYHEGMKILQLTFYEIRALRQGKPDAAFRTFLSTDDYITQDLKVSKVKWLKSSFYMMRGLNIFKSYWNHKEERVDHVLLLYIWSKDDMDSINAFFADYLSESNYDPWLAIHRYQTKIMKNRLELEHKKETDPIDALMATVGDTPEEFTEWAYEEAMAFSRYLIYEPEKKDTALCECTYCKKTGRVDRKKIRLRNNEKGVCPFCGSRVTNKVKGRLPSQFTDARWVAYVDPREDGFIWRTFYVYRTIKKPSDVDSEKICIKQGICEYTRTFYTFHHGKVNGDGYEYTVFKQSGHTRWCHDNGRMGSDEQILYPGNLPQAWEHTPMKYSAFEILSRNIPTESAQYERGIRSYIKYPFIEWLIKMGLNQIAKGALTGSTYGQVGKLKLEGENIFEILGLTKENTRVLQEIDGNFYELRLLQAAQNVGLRLNGRQLREYYETFECNIDLLRQAGRKASLHKVIKYISKESENYPIGETGTRWQYPHARYEERKDPCVERKRNMARDWIEYLKWCAELKYDLDNMFIYMPKNFKKVHDRTAKEYQALLDRRAAAKKKRREREAAKKMKKIKKEMEKILKENNGIGAFSITGKDLMLIVPQSADEIRAEGTTLHHCVGTYVDKVASGETMILFVRKIDAPDQPYFTVEWKNNKIEQCRGSNNSAPPEDVKAFMQAFEKKMQETMSAGNRKAG